MGEGKTVKVEKGTKKYWHCLCECGNETHVISASLVSGKTKSCGCARGEGSKGKKSFNWKGGKIINDDGYVKIWKGSKYYPEHRIVMEEFLGRKLNKAETVHHINGNKQDNSICNLELWSNSHPSGQRIIDKIKWCVEFLNQYSPELLKS